jgi:hypothetical protein
MSVEEVNVLELLERLSCKMSHCAGNKHYFDEKQEFLFVEIAALI